MKTQATVKKQQVTAKKTSTRKPLPTWTAPSDFKPFFADLYVRTDKDGLLCANKLKMTRYMGGLKNRGNPLKEYDWVAEDPNTVMALYGRVCMPTFVTNVLKRLPVNTWYRLTIRVSKRSVDNSLAVGFKEISKGVVKTVKTKAGSKNKISFVSLDKSDPEYRRFRRSSRFLPSAFQNVLDLRKREREEMKALREKASNLGFTKKKTSVVNK